MKQTEPDGMSRRNLLALAGMSVGATLLAPEMLFSATDETSGVVLDKANESFSDLKHVDAGPLNVAYVDAGPQNGRPVILLHGWPYDIHSYVDVAPLLASKGCRVLVPYLRGYGSTRFSSEKTFRNGQPSALAKDVIGFMD